LAKAEKVYGVAYEEYSKHLEEVKLKNDATKKAKDDHD